nr:MAG TPA: hypothetical protein [Caudoviricetes sp.]
MGSNHVMLRFYQVYPFNLLYLPMLVFPSCQPYNLLSLLVRFEARYTAVYLMGNSFNFYSVGWLAPHYL